MRVKRKEKQLVKEGKNPYFLKKGKFLACCLVNYLFYLVNIVFSGFMFLNLKIELHHRIFEVLYFPIEIYHQNGIKNS